MFLIGSGEFVQVVSSRMMYVKNIRKQTVMCRCRDAEI